MSSGNCLTHAKWMAVLIELCGHSNQIFSPFYASFVHHNYLPAILDLALELNINIPATPVSF